MAGRHPYHRGFGNRSVENNLGGLWGRYEAKPMDDLNIAFGVASIRAALWSLLVVGSAGAFLSNPSSILLPAIAIGGGMIPLFWIGEVLKIARWKSLPPDKRT